MNFLAWKWPFEALAPTARIHLIVVPCLLYLLGFSVAALNPSNVGWLMNGDLGQHFLGWTGFRYDQWRWPIGFSQLIAYPHGAPITVTDSNPLFSIFFKSTKN